MKKIISAIVAHELVGTTPPNSYVDDVYTMIVVLYLEDGTRVTMMPYKNKRLDKWEVGDLHTIVTEYKDPRQRPEFHKPRGSDLYAADLPNKQQILGFLKAEGYLLSNEEIEILQGKEHNNGVRFLDHSQTQQQKEAPIPAPIPTSRCRQWFLERVPTQFTERIRVDRLEVDVMTGGVRGMRIRKLQT